ncbi:hypothetical protein MRB53_003654 [Persea americana]|uniref:Uncharacterized protein n=1 Tax=Persea americana TaxID=3435 RepID=A0ACC2MZ15_PERAE|nr:hypothetical protein MRB53_003654 [Persea americana]
MVASPSPLSIAIFFFFSLNLPNNLDAAGFSFDLIHRDSPKSPFYNPSESHFDRVLRAIRRSNSRVNDFISSTSTTTGKDVSSTVLPNSGSYLMSISLGTPPFQILAVADTGSDLIWTQCLPCKTCFKQDAPLFNPSRSSSYVDLSCDSNMCSELPRHECASNESCSYSYSYGDRSYTTGVLAAETLTMNSSGSRNVKLPNITFGCGHDNGGTFNRREAGIVGLGGGPLSLVSQLSPSVDKKFAYCLVPFDDKKSSSRMDFGDSAVVSGNGTLYTPLISKLGYETFFYVKLQKISVGNKSISLWDLEEGNIILDSGTTLTYLPTESYGNLLSVLKDAIDLQPVTPPSNVDLELCYELGEDLKIPDLTFVYDGAKVVLGSLNTFIQVADNVGCFAFMGSNGFAIVGNVAQQNFKIGYDLSDMKVAFQPTDCTHH